MTTDSGPLIAKELRQAKSLVVAWIGLGGEVLDANAGFLRLLPKERGTAGETNATDIFVLPRFSDFLATLPSGDGPVFHGLFTLSNETGKTWTLSGHLTRLGDHLHFFAEHDIDASEALQEKVLELNQTLAEARRQVARMNRDLEAQVAQRTAELSASEARFRNLVEQSLVGICILQGDGFRYVNPALVSLAAYPSAEAMVSGMRFLDLVVPADRERTTLELRRLEQGEVKEVRSTCAGIRSNGTPLDLEWHGSPCEYERAPALILILLDVSERHRAEVARERALAEAERLSRLKSEFINNMSHELKTPLNGVIGMAGSIMRATTLEKAQSAGARVRESGNAILRIVEDVLDFSAAEAGSLDIAIAPLDLADSLDQASQRAGERARALGLGYHDQRGDDLPRFCLGDRRRLIQILDNLLGNAVKFTQHGEVVFTALREGDQLLLRVDDSGIGIAPEHLERLFQPFEQADGSSTRRFGGTGLGLAITQQQTRLMGGSIRVSSRPGEGSRFEVRLPLLESTAAVYADARLIPADTDPPTLLALENNELEQMILAEHLCAIGMRWDFADTEDSLLEQLRRQPNYASILVPCDLRGADDLDLLRQIHGNYPALPIIGTFYDNDPEAIARCRGAGMAAYLLKPYLPEAIRETVHSLTRAAKQRPGH